MIHGRFDVKRLAWPLALLTVIFSVSAAASLPENLIQWFTQPTSAVPSTLEGRRWIYVAALWALMSITSLSLAVLWDNARCWRARGESDWRHPLNVSIAIESLLLATIVMGFAPDTVFLLV